MLSLIHICIPQNKLSEIFERFSQGENANNPHYQGTGIGLALSKEIVNLHHGIIRAESPEGQGAVFIVELLLGKEMCIRDRGGCFSSGCTH